MLHEYQTAYYNFSESMLNHSRFGLLSDQKKYIDEFKNELKNNIKLISKSEVFFRAQYGCDREDIEIDGKPIATKPTVFPVKRMKPLKHTSKEGRLNPKGISYLYLASNKETAISECRPWVGSYMSLGIFEINRDINIISFLIDQQEEEPEPKEYVQSMIEKKFVWNDISKAFAKPISDADDKAEYSPTQYLSEVIKSEGYDGIEFTSSVGNGSNIALFNLDDATITSRYLIKIIDINVGFVPMSAHISE